MTNVCCVRQRRQLQTLVGNEAIELLSKSAAQSGHRTQDLTIDDCVRLFLNELATFSGFNDLMTS